MPCKPNTSSGNGENRLDKRLNQILLALVAAAGIATLNKIDKVSDLAISNAQRIAVIESRMGMPEKESKP